MPSVLVKGWDCLSDKVYVPQRWVKFNNGEWHRLHPLSKTRYTIKTTKTVCAFLPVNTEMYLMTFAGRPRAGEPICSCCARGTDYG